MPRSVKARDNFFGLFSAPKEPEVQLMDPEDHAAILRDAAHLAAQFNGRVDAFLIHAPDRLGRNFWYYFVSQRAPTPRMFERASAYTMPKGLIKSKTPWKDVRMNLQSSRHPNDIQFAVIDAISGKTEGPLSLTSIAKRNPRGRRAVPGRDKQIALKMLELLATLHELKSLAWVAHWSARGPNFYSLHLMYQRIYEGMDEPIDELGERYVGYTSTAIPYNTFKGKALPPDVEEMMMTRQAKIVVHSVIGEAQRLSDEVRAMLDGTLRGNTTSGLDDYLMALNNTLDTYKYLLSRLMLRGE